MRKIALTPPPVPVGMQEPIIKWMLNAIREIQAASHDQITEEIADAFTVSNVTETRTLDADSVTLAELADVVGTLLQDMKNRGPKRG